jgi:hypothetical protein
MDNDLQPGLAVPVITDNGPGSLVAINSICPFVLKNC